MKALALSSFDEGPSVMEVDDPVADPGEVLVRVAAASINAWDVRVASGGVRAFMTYEFPAVVGGDLAGTVEAVGEDVDGFTVGDRVFGMMGVKGGIHDGSFGELATPTAASIARAPDGLHDVDAGSLAVAGTTAMSAVEAIAPSEGTTVLVLGATGGVGSFALQLAHIRGAHVIASARPGDEKFVTDLGADETIDYTGDLAGDVHARYPAGVDAVVDAVSFGDEAFEAMADLVGDGGTLVSTRGAAGDKAEIGGVRVANGNGDPAHLTALADLVVDGKLMVPVRKTYPLADGAQAIADFAEQHTVGKLVITM
ncbi:MAG TPA: NADP-dependent oxidoreductase [Actinomycetota bacterium]|nr:NADP-dependent oxidoreductase [Actinomycetota bacterium]